MDGFRSGVAGRDNRLAQEPREGAGSMTELLHRELTGAITVSKQVGLVFNFGSTQPEFERVYLPVDSELAAQEVAAPAMPEP